MGMFRYEAEDKAGKVLRGVMNASDEQQVAQNLTRMGYSPRSIYASSGGHQASAPASSVVMAPPASHQTRGAISITASSGVPVSIKSRVSASKLAMFFRQLATLVKSGRPLNQSMTDVAVRDGRIRDALPRIQSSLQSGQNLSGTMALFPDIFPVHTIASVWSGELAGKLDLALDEIASDFELESSEMMISRIGWGLTKATLLSFALLAPACNLENLLMPAAAQAMSNSGSSTENALKMIIQGYMHMVVTQSLPICAGLIVSWIVWGYMKRVPTLKRTLDGLLLRVPIWGRLHRYRSLSRFLHVLDGLTAAGITLSTACDAASLTVRNSEVAEKLKLARNSLSVSAGISSMFAASGVFDTDDISMAVAGEKSGSIPDVLANLSKVYSDRASSHRTMGRMWSVSSMITFMLIVTGYAVIKMTASYFDLMFKVGDAMGH